MRRLAALAFVLSVGLVEHSHAADALPSSTAPVVFSMSGTKVRFERSWTANAALRLNWSLDPRHNSGKIPPVPGETQLWSGDVLDASPSKDFAQREAGGPLPRLIVFSPVEPEFGRSQLAETAEMLKAARKSHPRTDKTGFWRVREGAYAAARAGKSRPLGQRLVVYCTTNSEAAASSRPRSCRVGFYWNEGLLIRYVFNPKDVPQQEWQSLDKRVLALLNRIILP